jgi:hypothetical protein
MNKNKLIKLHPISNNVENYSSDQLGDKLHPQ